MKVTKVITSLTSYIYLLIALGLMSSQAWTQEQPNKPKIGVIVVLSGPVAEAGESVKNSIELAKQAFDPENKVTIVFEDDQFQPKNAVSAAWKLIDVDHVDALITFGGSTSNAIADIAERKKIPMLAITALASIGKGRDYVNSIFLSTKGQTEVLSEAASKANLNRIAVITNTQEALLFLKDDFIKSNKDKIVSSDEITPGDFNVSSQVTKIRVSKPDAVLLYVLPPQVSLFANKLREQGFKGQFLGGPPMFSSSEIKAAKGNLTGAWLPGPKSAAIEEFVSKYKVLHKRVPISEGVYGYDSAHLFIEALNSGDAEKYISELKSFSGLAGEYPRVENNKFEVPAELRVIGGDGELRVGE